MRPGDTNTKLSIREKQPLVVLCRQCQHSCMSKSKILKCETVKCGFYRKKKLHIDSNEQKLFPI